MDTNTLFLVCYLIYSLKETNVVSKDTFDFKKYVEVCASSYTWKYAERKQSGHGSCASFTPSGGQIQNLHVKLERQDHKLKARPDNSHSWR